MDEIKNKAIGGVCQEITVLQLSSTHHFANKEDSEDKLYLQIVCIKQVIMCHYLLQTSHQWYSLHLRKREMMRLETMQINVSPWMGRWKRNIRPQARPHLALNWRFSWEHHVEMGDSVLSMFFFFDSTKGISKIGWWIMEPWWFMDVYGILHHNNSRDGRYKWYTISLKPCNAGPVLVVVHEDPYFVCRAAGRTIRLNVWPKNESP